MPDHETTRKRSRSPSDSEQQKTYKRPNTGGTALDASSANSTGLVSQSSASRITMADRSSSSAAANDTTNSTPNSSRNDAKNHDNGDHRNGADGKDSATTTGDPSSSTSAPPPPAGNIHMRCLIVTQDASIIIGKGGSHVNEIREKSGARVMVSESIPGNPERILNVSGPLDAVSKVVSATARFVFLCRLLTSFAIRT
jgi:heterogeneous nuclear rnp K-like protein